MAEKSSVTIAMMMPGDMGHSIGKVLQSSTNNSIRLITNLTGRSPRTQALAHSAGIIDVHTDEEVVRQANWIFSIVVPSQSMAVAQRFASYLTAKNDVIYVDMNAIAPETVRSIADLFPHGNFVDGSILGSPPIPSSTEKTSIYLCGRHAQPVADLFLGIGSIETFVIGEEIGQASALKMCYASLSKGVTALTIQAAITAKAHGLDQVLFDELKKSMPDIYQKLSRSIPRVPPKAGRWVGEMLEIAKTHENVGLSPQVFQGIAETYRFIAEKTPLGQEILEDRKQGTTLDDALNIMVQSLNQQK